PDQEETEYFWKLFHAAQRNDARWHGSEISIIADELSRTDLDRNQKLFLLRSWQVLVDDKGGFGRFMGAFDTYVYNMQDPDDDCVAWKPELAQILNDGNCFDVLLDAYQEAQQRIAELERANAAQDDHFNQQQDRIDVLERRNQPGADGYDDWYVHSADDGEYLKADDVIEAIRAAGIKVKES
ncbi:hypothetical protein AAK01_004711, partial [Salmonella enterica subsp. enterica]|nr:hypothetical protein [Salmonella enterica subsp. enterica]